jgi:hypothetical protein
MLQSSSIVYLARIERERERKRKKKETEGNDEEV